MTRSALGKTRAGGLALGLVAAGVTPAAAWLDNDPDAYVVNFFTGGGSNGILFGAGSYDQHCNNLGPARIQVLSTTPGVKLSVEPGAFVVTGTDYGYLVCLNQQVPGTVVRGSGQGQAKIRVYYQPIEQWYDHTLTVGGP